MRLSLQAQWISLDKLAEAAIFLVSSASDSVNGVIFPPCKQIVFN